MVKKMPGYSLVELIVVIGLVTILMLAISGIMLMSIVSSNRLRVATKTKQAGSYALSQLQSMIRNARTIDCQNAPESITIGNSDGGQTIFTLENNHIASNSGYYLTPDNLTIPSFNFTCEGENTPSLIKISFNLQDSMSTLHFETSVNLRNQ